ncbi:MAG: YgaP family membrane protein [Methylobacter sp.]
MNFDFKRMLKFEHNIGEKEKKYRLYGGVALLVISLFIPGGEVLLLLVGLVLVATGYSGWCPAYSGLNKNTCETAGNSAETSSTESDSTES